MSKRHFGWLRNWKVFWWTKRFIKRLQRRELWLRPELKVPLCSIGFGDFCPAGLGPSSVIYSLGVGDDFTFDLAFMDRFGADIHAFDPTPISIELVEKVSLPDGFKFHPWAITNQDATIRFYPRIRKDGSLSTVQYTINPKEGSPEHAVEVSAFTAETVMRKLGHESIDLMKMNIRGC